MKEQFAHVTSPPLMKLVRRKSSMNFRIGAKSPLSRHHASIE